MGNFIDGFGALIAFRDPMAVPSARVKHLRTLGVAEFAGHNGIVITAPAMLVNLVKEIDDSDAVKEEMGLPTQQHVNVLEGQGTMDKVHLTQSLTASQLLSDGLVKMIPDAATLGLTLIAGTEVSAPAPDAFRKRGMPMTTFCCLVCSDGHSVKRKAGLALVVASKHRWSRVRITYFLK
jgi:hypothetical protein